jgi:hypothetical protein
MAGDHQPSPRQLAVDLAGAGIDFDLAMPLDVVLE